MLTFQANRLYEYKAQGSCKASGKAERRVAATAALLTLGYFVTPFQG